MRGHTERDDVVFLAVELEIDGVVTFVAVQDEDAIPARLFGFCVSVKMPNPIETNFVRCLAVWRRSNPPVAWNRVVLVPIREVIFARNHHVRRDAETDRANALDHCNPFPIARLPHLHVGTSFRACNDHPVGDNAHLGTVSSKL